MSNCRGMILIELGKTSGKGHSPMAAYSNGRSKIGDQLSVVLPMAQKKYWPSINKNKKSETIYSPATMMEVPKSFMKIQITFERRMKDI